MGSYVLGLQQIDREQVALVGGKGAHLGELARIDGVRVPPGFCVTTEAFERILANAPELAGPLDRLSNLDPDDRDAISAGSAEVRQALEAIAIPDDLAAEITDALVDGRAYAVRSSATAEDLPGASFAGQQDTYLNVIGAESVLRHLSRCWASLFTERAVTYRLRNGFDHRKVRMAVVVQQMVFPQAAGILFTADPVTSNRKVATVEASFGLGEALVSGLVNADHYQVRDGEIIDKEISAKQRAVLAVEGGGTEEQPIAEDQRDQAALTDDQVVRLVELGRAIEAHFGRPQDIEWCLADDEFQIVQSRPITTLFPIPEATGEGNRVYVSVGHQQMMTDAMKPLGLSVWQLTTPRPMAEAGGRLFADATPLLTVPKSRAGFLEVAGKTDPLMGDALETVLSREGFLPLADEDAPGAQVPGVAPATIETDPAVVTELIGHSEASVATLRREIATKSGNELLDFIFEDIKELRRILFDPRSHQVFTAAMQASWWLNDHLRDWLGEKNVADTLTQSVPHNVTAEMGLALLDVADVVRNHPEVGAFLQDVEDNGFLDELPKLPGGEESRAAIQGYLDKYGMRCVGEIDITRPRWSEQPVALVPMLLSNIKNFEPGAGKRRFEEGRREALDKARDVLERLRALPDGVAKAEETERMIERVRTFTGYREYPKYGMVSRYFAYKQALLDEARRLVRAGVLDEPEDLFFLRLREFREVVRTHEVDRELIRRRKEEFRSFASLTPPRVLTSDGEALSGKYRRADLPEGALVGLPVSAGTIEGRARVILDLADAALEPGDILVTAYTDPSWSPLFVAITGLVTEVGGQMTHGAVIAREYGLPAVVGVQNATRLIKDGQRIRVNGTDGYLEVLDAR
ncbi:rifamycin-inactivating phosphotransferase [Amycolatopsis orientalis]|uniref:rifamycin-inactivating phosphotransferase n=1 Tax=Amycolatopsis orientalis TaxID=31958 RepID=UPI0003AA7EED|nr:rifamycin-inactivating phosphotransferase [Amycolatopsis orientalis]